MAKVTVHIEAESPADFHTTLQELIGGAAVPTTAVVPETGAVAPGPAKPTINKKAADNKQPEPVAETQNTALTPTAKEKPTKITHEDLRDAMKFLKASVSRRLVAEFSGKAPEERPRLSDVPPEKYADMMAEAKRLSQLPENIKQDKADE